MKINKINIGAGKFKKDGWTNIDHVGKHYNRKNDIDMNFLEDQKFPIDDNSVRIAYCSHMFEHLPKDVLFNLAKETYRVLKPGGTFRVTCPDAVKGAKAMLKNDLSFFSMYQEYAVFNDPKYMKKYSRTAALKDATIYQQFIYMVASAKCIYIDVPCEKITDEIVKKLFSENTIDVALDKICTPVDAKITAANPWMHTTWWGPEKVKNYLLKAGFPEVTRAECGYSRVDELRDTTHFDTVFPWYCLYIEGVK